MKTVGSTENASAARLLREELANPMATRPLLRAARYSAARLPLSLMVELDTDCSAKCSVTSALMNAGDSGASVVAPSSATAGPPRCPRRLAVLRAHPASSPVCMVTKPTERYHGYFHGS